MLKVNPLGEYQCDHLLEQEIFIAIDGHKSFTFITTVHTWNER